MQEKMLISETELKGREKDTERLLILYLEGLKELILSSLISTRLKSKSTAQHEGDRWFGELEKMGQVWNNYCLNLRWNLATNE